MPTERNSKGRKQKKIKFRVKFQIHDFARLFSASSYGFSHPMGVQMPHGGSWCHFRLVIIVITNLRLIFIKGLLYMNYFIYS